MKTYAAIRSEQSTLSSPETVFVQEVEPVQVKAYAEWQHIRATLCLVCPHDR